MTRYEWLCKFRLKLRQLMEEKGMTQRELADKLYVSEATVSKYINGELMPSVRMVINISYALNVSIDSFTYFCGRIN